MPGFCFKPSDVLNCVTDVNSNVLTITTPQPYICTKIGSVGGIWLDDEPRTTLTNCPNCGAPLRGKKKRCEYCATEF